MDSKSVDGAEYPGYCRKKLKHNRRAARPCGKEGLQVGLLGACFSRFPGAVICMRFLSSIIVLDGPGAQDCTSSLLPSVVMLYGVKYRLLSPNGQLRGVNPSTRSDVGGHKSCDARHCSTAKR